MCQSSYIALDCKISLLSRQRTTKELIRLRGCAGWSAPLLFTYDKNRFSHDVAHFQIIRSCLCRIRKKRVCCLQFYGEKNNSRGHFFFFFCRGFIENKFALTPSICVRNGTTRLFVQRPESVLKSTSSYRSIAETSYIAGSAHMSNLRISENHHHFWTVQDSLMKYHRWAYLINLGLLDKNENCYISSFLVMCP